MVSNDLKQMVLDYLQKNAGYNSAEDIAHNLNTSKTAVIDAAQELTLEHDINVMHCLAVKEDDDDICFYRVVIRYDD